MFGPTPKTNIFNTFLDTVNSTSSPVQSSAAGQQPSTPTGSLDAVLGQLLSHKVVHIRDLLPITNFSLDDLSRLLASLESLDFVTRAGSEIQITAAGSEVAAQRQSALK